MPSNPLTPWVGLAFIELVLGMIVMAYTVRVQLAQFQFKSHLQPLKWLLLGALISLIIFNLPLLNIYMATLLGHGTQTWETALAVVANATGHLVFAVFLMLVYRFKGVD